MREACNKIIHAIDLRPIYDHSDREVGENARNRVWYMTGEIEIGGMKGREQWSVVLHVEVFLEMVLDRIAFTPPAPAAAQA